MGVGEFKPVLVYLYVKCCTYKCSTYRNISAEAFKHVWGVYGSRRI
jgi:hypothetical protein